MHDANPYHLLGFARPPGLGSCKFGAGLALGPLLNPQNQTQVLKFLPCGSKKLMRIHLVDSG